MKGYFSKFESTGFFNFNLLIDGKLGAKSPLKILLKSELKNGKGPHLDQFAFDVDPQTLQIDSIEVQQFNDKEGRKITLGKAHIQGMLTVSDQQQFRNSFKNGIGKGRAFGCGLLQIVPVIDNPFA